MELKSFEEYLEESKNKVYGVELFKLTPSEIKKIYINKKSFTSILPYNKVLEVINGDFKNFLFSNTNYCDMYNRTCLYLDLDESTIVHDGDKTIITYKNDKSLESMDTIIKYNDNGYIEQIVCNNIFVNRIFKYIYDNKNRLIHYNDSMMMIMGKRYNNPSIMYDDENQISYDKNSLKHTKYNDNQNVEFSVYFSDIVNNIVRKLEKYIYKDDGTILIISINILTNQMIPFEF